MRTLSLLLLTLALSSPLARADDEAPGAHDPVETPPTAAQPKPPGTYFTTVFYDDGGIVYVGLRRTNGEEAESQVISFPFPSGNRDRLPLPEEVQHREVIGLIPDRQKLFVLTQGGEGKAIGPMLHLYDRAKNSWKKIGGIACPSFTKVKLSATQMTFFCEGATIKTRRGPKTVTTPKPLHFKGERIYRSGTWRFPEFMLRYKSAMLLLEGPAPVWDRLRIKSEQGERLMKAEELFEIPVPVPTTSIGPSN